MEKIESGCLVKYRHLRSFSKILATLMIAALLGGCCGMTNVQAQGGGAGGLASLGVLVLGATAMQRLCNEDTGREPNGAPPPRTDDESEDNTRDDPSTETQGQQDSRPVTAAKLCDAGRIQDSSG